MRSTLVVTTPAGDLSLLTQAERRAAAGLASGDASQDAALAAMDLRAAAAICQECNIAPGVGREPTLMRETLTETIRGARGSCIILSRRHDVAITSVVADDATLDLADYDVDPESGILYRLSGNCTTSWCYQKAVVVYAAGFATVPQALKNAAFETLTAFWRDIGRDPYVKGTTIENVDIGTVRTDLWSGSLPGSSIGAIPDSARGHLTRFYNQVIG